MATLRLLYVDGTTGLPKEHAQTDDIVFSKFQVNGGPTLNTNLSMTGGNITSVNEISFVDPSTDGIVQTAGTLTADNIMAKERNNVMSTTGAILFGAVTDTGGELDSFKIPNISGTPTAVPTFSSAPGYMVFDGTNNLLYAWNGEAWSNSFASATQTPKVVDTASFSAAVSLTANDVVYVSGEGLVSPADASAESTARALGFATGGASTAAAASIQFSGNLAGFSGLVAGSRYFLSETPGQITTTVASTALSNIVQCGYGVNSTTLNVIFQQIVIRTA